MAFDKDNASIISNVIAGDGVTITHSQVDGVDTFNAAVDQTWLAAYLATNVGGSLPLSAADEARIAALEAAVGTATPTVSTPTATPTGTTGTTTIAPSMGVSGLSELSQITYSLIGIDGTVLASETLMISAGSTINTVSWGLWSNISASISMSKYFSNVAITDDNVVITWKTANVGSTFNFTVDMSNSADSLAFTVTDY